MKSNGATNAGPLCYPERSPSHLCALFSEAGLGAGDAVRAVSHPQPGELFAVGGGHGLVHDLLVREAVANRAGFLGGLVGLTWREEADVEHVYLLLAFRREKACYAAANVLEVDAGSVRALPPILENDEPEWVAWVQKEWEGFRDVESVTF